MMEMKALLEEVSVNGTLIWYYYICPREVWLMVRHITPDESDDNIQWGRYLHEHSYEREKKEIKIGNIKLDLLQKEDGRIIIGEVKKSSKYLESARMQLLFYLSELKKIGINAEGKLIFPEEKKTIDVHLDESAEEELQRACANILELIAHPLPPPASKSHWCTNCAYAEFCWA